MFFLFLFSSFYSGTYKTQVVVLPIHKVFQTLVKDYLRPKQKFLGLRLAFTSVWDTFYIGKTMTCDLCDVLNILNHTCQGCLLNRGCQTIICFYTLHQMFGNHDHHLLSVLYMKSLPGRSTARGAMRPVINHLYMISEMYFLAVLCASARFGY